MILEQYYKVVGIYITDWNKCPFCGHDEYEIDETLTYPARVCTKYKTTYSTIDNARFMEEKTVGGNYHATSC